MLAVDLKDVVIILLCKPHLTKHLPLASSCLSIVDWFFDRYRKTNMRLMGVEVLLQVNNNLPFMVDVADLITVAGSIGSSLIRFIIIIFLFSSCTLKAFC